MSIIEMETQIMPYDVRNKGCFKINVVTNMDKSKAGIPNLKDQSSKLQSYEKMVYSERS